MSDLAVPPHPVATTFRWTARVWAVVSVVIILLFAVGEGFFGVFSSAQLALKAFFFPIATSLGLILAWRWERLGGLIAVAGIAAFYLDSLLVSSRFPRGPWFFLLAAAPGLLFLASSALHTTGRRARAS